MVIFLTLTCIVACSLSAFLAGTLIQVRRQNRLEITVVRLQELFSVMEVQPAVGDILRDLGFAANIQHQNGAPHVVTSQGVGNVENLVGS